MQTDTNLVCLLGQYIRKILFLKQRYSRLNIPNKRFLFGSVSGNILLTKKQNRRSDLLNLGKKDNERRANWEAYEIMFGNGSYISNETDLIPLYNIYVEGIPQ